MRLFESSNLMMDESMLTGELASVAKFVSAVEAGNPDALDMESASHVFSGTLVTQGIARGPSRPRFSRKRGAW